MLPEQWLGTPTEDSPMKIAIATCCLAAVSSLLAARSVRTTPAADRSAPLAVAMATGYHAAVVRAEYAAVGGRIANTICHLTNTSVSQSLTLKQVVVMGAGGAGSIMAIYNGLFDQVVPPLGTVDLSIDSNLSGVVQETAPNGPGVRQVAFIWDGDAELVNLTASIETSLSFNIYTRAELIERGVLAQP